MIDPTQNTKRMSSGTKGSYTLSDTEEHKAWTEKLSDFFDKLTSDKQIESNNDKLLENKRKLEDYKRDIELKLKKMRKSSEKEMSNIERSLENSLDNISSTLKEIERRIN